MPYQPNYYPMQGYQMPVYPGQAQPMMDSMAQMRQQQMQPQQQPILLGRAVSDIAEARAVPSDLSGQPMFFPDLSHNAIHLKVFNPQTGAGDFYTFNLAQPAAAAAQKPVQRPAAAQVRYALAEDVEAIQGQIQGIRDDVSRLMGRDPEVKHDV